MSLKVAVFGCGSISRGHVQRLLSVEDLDIVACADPKQEAVEAIAQKVEDARGSRPDCYSSPKEALAEHQPDAVAVFTPHTLHFGHAMAALEAGAHVLMEKPMVCTAADADALIAKAEQKQRLLAVAYQMRSAPIYREMRQMVQDGLLGELRAVAVLLTQDWIDRIKASGRIWRFDPALSGGGELMDSGSHLLDVLLWSLGTEPEEVFAFVNNLGLDVDVLSVSSFRFPGGAVGTFTISGDAPGWTSSLTLTGTEGTIVLTPNRMTVARKGVDTEVREIDMKLPADAGPALNFIRAIRGEEGLLCPATDALPVVRTTEALYRSAEQGAPVRVG